MLAPPGTFLTSADVSSDTPLSLHSPSSSTLLQGKVSTIHASAVFHLFSEENQRALAQRLASLLVLETESVILGQHRAKHVKGFSQRVMPEFVMFCHSPECCKKTWVEDVLGEDGANGAHAVEVGAQLIEVES
ncbi:hypothetical protein BDZ97DRAFT_1759097 [Flammula alnicola]|nr:hypothetical protein BDZ97DRAFT_1759097 [Flammula alnicola]